MRKVAQKVTQVVVWAIPVLAYVALVPTAFAAYISPSGPVFPGASYSVNEDISNASASSITVTNDWYYRINGGGWNSWCHEVNAVPANGNITVSCGSTGDAAGTVMEFQVNTWRPDYSGSVSWSNTGFTVQSPPATASASLSPSGDVYPNTALSLSGSVSGSGYTGTNCWAYSVNGGARSCWFSPGAGTGNFSYSWSAGSADPSTTYTFYLCTDNGAGSCATAGSLRIVAPPTLTATLSVSPTSAYTNTAVSFTTTVSGTATNLSYSGQSCGGGTISNVNGGSFSCSYGSAGTYYGSVTVSGTGVSPVTKMQSVSISNPPVASVAFSNLNTAPYNTGLYLQWTSANVTSCTLSGGTFNTVSVPAAHSGFSYWTGNLTAATTYTLNCAAVSGASGNTTATITINVAPSEPTVTASTGSCGGNINLVYGGGVNATSYRLYRSTSGTSPFPLLSTVLQSTDTGLSPGQTYYYQVQAIDAGGSAYSTIVSGKASAACVTSQPNVTISQKMIVGKKSNSTSAFLASADDTSYLAYVATVANSGSALAYNLQVDYQWSGNNSTGFQSFGDYGGSFVDQLPTSAGQTAVNVSDSSTDWTGGTKYVKACVTYDYIDPDTQLLANGSTCTPPVAVVFAPPPPPPNSPCVVYVNDRTNSSSGDWITDADVSVIGCPSTEYQNLQLTGRADLEETGVDMIYDTSIPGYRKPLSADQEGIVPTLRAASQNTCTNGSCPGFGFSTLLSVPSGFPNTTFRLTNVFGTGDEISAYFHILPPGQYSYTINNAVTGQYLCYTRTETKYVDECDPANIKYNSATCALPSERQRPANLSSPYTYVTKTPLFGNISADTTLMECAVNNRVSGTNYYVQNCTNHTYDAAPWSMSPNPPCPNGPTTPTFVPAITHMPSQPPPADFTHYLTVKSTQDGAASGGLIVTQSSGAPTGMGGTTDSATAVYTRQSLTNVDILLTAPNKHSVTGNNFVGWDAYNAATNSGCDDISANTKDCHIKLTFDTSGGKTRTVTANYSGKLDAPVITTSTAQCDANGGKVNVYLQSAVSGASGYKLYRRSASTAASLIKDFSAASAPFSGNPYSDNTGTPNTTYYYTMTAYNASANSPASAEISRAASLPCPDLIVEPGSVQIIDTASPPNVLDPTAVPSGTPIKFRAKIRNQNGATMQSFDNQFQLDGNQNSPYTSKAQPQLSGLGAGIDGLSSYVISLAVSSLGIGNHSLQVCADMPPPKPGTIKEDNTTGNAEDNNCLSSPFSFSVVVPITVQLQCEQAGGTFKNDYCVIDYANTSNLRWTITGNPTSCAASTGTDWTGTKTNQSYTVTGNPFSITNLLNKLSFKYQLDCTR